MSCPSVDFSILLYYVDDYDNEDSEFSHEGLKESYGMPSECLQLVQWLAVSIIYLTILHVKISYYDKHRHFLLKKGVDCPNVSNCLAVMLGSENTYLVDFTKIISVILKTESLLCP